MAITPKMGIPLLEGADVLARQRFNEALQHIDDAALSIGHVDSKAHWPMWEPNKEYFLVNVVRTETCPEWGYLECTQAGISGSVVPTDLFGEGDTKTDGSVIWTLRRIGGGTKHGDLTGRTLPDQHPIQAITGLQDALDSKENPENKGQPNGYAGLDSNGRILITQLPINVKEMRVLANIDERNALVSPELYDGLRVRVLDATGDPTVSSGWAEYVYDANSTSWIKLSEKESMDIVLDFANIQNVPDVLKNLSAVDGKLNYSGSPVCKDVRAVKFIGGDAELIYDWDGKITCVKINCNEVRSEDTEFSVEVAKKDDYTNQLNVWSNVGVFTLNAGYVYGEYPLSEPFKISAGDVIRASPVGDDTGLAFTVIVANN